MPCSGDGTLRKYVLDAVARGSDSAAVPETRAPRPVGSADAAVGVAPLGGRLSQALRFGAPTRRVPVQAAAKGVGASPRPRVLGRPRGGRCGEHCRRQLRCAVRFTGRGGSPLPRVINVGRALARAHGAPVYSTSFISFGRRSGSGSTVGIFGLARVCSRVIAYRYICARINLFKYI